MPAVDPETVLDALAGGLSIHACAAQFGLPEAEVRAIRKAEADRLADGEEIRQQHALANRRLLKMELAFHAKAMAEMDPSAAVIALKANERRFSLNGAGAAQPSHLLMIMNQQKIEAAPTSTDRLRRVLDELKAEGNPPAQLAGKPDQDC